MVGIRRILFGRVLVVSILITPTRCLSRGSRAAEVEAQPALPIAFAGNFRVDLLGVIASFGNGLGTGFQACFNLGDLGIGVLPRIDPIPLRWQPIADEIFCAAAVIARQTQRVRQDNPTK